MLVEEKILPDQNRHAPKGVQTPWRKFIALHMSVMVACDFFGKTRLDAGGQAHGLRADVRHLGSRKVFVSPSTSR